MQFNTIDRDNLSPELQEQLTRFEQDLSVYVGLQERLTELVQEEQRLKQQALTLEGQASRTDTSWKAMAQSATIDQGKINEEIERSAQLKKDAQALRLTAEVRSGPQGALVIQLAEARMKLVRVPTTINKAYQQTLLANALAREGVRESLLELFALSRALFLKSIDEHDGMLSSCNSQRERQAKIQELSWRAFGQEVQKLFDGAEQNVQAPTLAVMPGTVHREVLVETPGDLMRLKQARKA
ncbi:MULTISPECIES: hypothetical protein [Pseudomonas]|uniref:hypothetical protein n=1 Tax=Pseudomonas TaxID=286 RepID=UPI0005A87294|nr:MULTISPECIES: hypothetical protein [Pseudomonas]AZD91066.1 hypothetical protein C4K13_1634 [Pseudomonas chlororaphis subsp. aureofaciens]KAB0530126.1 hypothetical protein F7R16_21015 [Pseudomonas chlororaphis subsp. aureofaciens]TSD31435.1 hypothetical protein FCE86_018265 [Pseudomonas sp. ATCC 13985]WDG62060.1 hypothetical protein PUP52_09015 [Pseudomonas chlororaphis]WDG68270.1 hypothetical protein PUP59_09020 [Pseudomonas chlororaphis]